MVDETVEKTCNSCGESYPATTEFFRRRKHGRYGVSAKCWVCERIEGMEKARKRRLAGGCVPRPTTEEIDQFWREQQESMVGYLAGLIDGEGCICISKTYARAKKERRLDSRQYLFLSVSITSTTRSLVLWLRKHFGGSFRVKKTAKDGWKECYGWRLISEQAAGLLRRTMPYLIVKQQQAQIALEFQNRLSRRHGHKLTDEEMNERLTLKEQLEALR